MKKLRKILIAVLIAFVILFGSVSAYLYLNQDKVVKQLIVAINEQLTVPVEVGEISINWYTDFPNIAVVFNNITIQEAIDNSSFPLAKLETLALSFNLIALIQGEYVFDKVTLRHGEVTIRVSPSGQRNYLITKKGANTSGNQNVNFDLSQINIDKVKINYVDEPMAQSYLTFAESISASLNKDGADYDIKVTGLINTEAIKLDDLSYFEGKELVIDTKLVYNENNETVKIQPSEITVNKSKFEVGGSYAITSSFIDLKIAGINTNFQTISSLLPNEYSRYLAKYKTKGETSFNSAVKGIFNSRNNPLVSMDFNIANGSLYEPEYQTRLDSIYLKGTFTNGGTRSFRTSTLTLQNITAQMKGQTINAEIELKNFDNYHLRLTTEGRIATKDLFAFIPHKENFSALEGDIEFNLGLSGYIEDFKQASTASRVNNTGEIRLQNVGGTYSHYPLPISNINGRLLFNKNDIAINTLQGKIGVSDIRMNGFFLNIFPYLLRKGQSLLIEADTKSNYIDLNELLSGLSNEQSTQQKQQESYKFSISPFLRLELKSEINKLIFQNFEGRNIAGKINVANQNLRADNLKLNSMGGKIQLSGAINTMSVNDVDIHTTANFSQLNIDSIFYTFKNFDQNFLTQQHLKGKINADVMAHIVMDKALNFKPEEFTASIAANITNGQLNNFEPMQSLSDYVNEKQLANLSFGELSNSIQIKNKTIYLPEMRINSNISEILIQGTHTFDQQIDYRLLVPLKNYKRPDKDTAFGAIEETEDYTKLHLKITGTTDDFHVNWDAKQSLKSVGEKVKEEGKNLIKIITGKNVRKEKKKEVEVTEDDYFDW